MQVRIERAVPPSHQRLSEIAFAAKRHWDYPEAWIHQWRDALTITPEFIAANEVYAASVDGQVVGFYALVGSDVKVTLDHLWVLPSQIGGGIGRKLFNHAVEMARQQGATEIEIEADPNAVAFYERMGATRVGENVYELEGQPRRLPLLTYKVV
ncbi:MAG: GNAT family N-acetyltransferase [Blastocatellia bacterium]